MESITVPLMEYMSGTVRHHMSSHEAGAMRSPKISLVQCLQTLQCLDRSAGDPPSSQLIELLLPAEENNTAQLEFRQVCRDVSQNLIVVFCSTQGD